MFLQACCGPLLWRGPLSRADSCTVCCCCCVLQLARQFYSSYAQFEADCRMIVEAARAYHTPGRGGRQPIPIVIQAASNTVTEGLKVLQTPEAQANIAYWEMRINVSGVFFMDAAVQHTCAGRDCVRMRTYLLGSCSL